MTIRRILGAAFLMAQASMAGFSSAIAAGAAASPAEEFFIVSSVDSDKGTIVLKRPTETTLTMRVTDKTRCVGLKGEAIRFTDLRAGDTVFIASSAVPAASPVASSIRRGPMTVDELHRRYLRF
jgi:hypothetical protein